MKWKEQGAAASDRYTVVPRTLIFITAESDLLLLRGAPTKRIWPARLNGIGGHLEASEDPLDGARREVREETGLELDALTLRGLIQVAGQAPHPGVLLFVYVARTAKRAVKPSTEGALEWHPLHTLPYDEMVEDLPHLLPLLFGDDPCSMVFGSYQADADGEMSYHFQCL
jgi:8-oxo-dGTP diphosphatase